MEQGTLSDAYDPVVDEVYEASRLAKEVVKVSVEIEKEMLPELEYKANSEEMQYLFQCVDNFTDKVLPKIGADVAKLEEAVMNLEATHNNKVSPMNAFIQDVIFNQKSKLGVAHGDQLGKDHDTVVREYTDNLTVQSIDDLLDSLYGDDEEGVEEE